MKDECHEVTVVTVVAYRNKQLVDESAVAEASEITEDEGHSSVDTDEFLVCCSPY
jgi:hypothetical protein